MRNFLNSEGPKPTLDAFKGAPRQSYYYLPILPKFDCDTFDSGTSEQKIAAIDDYIRKITAQFGRLAHNIKANNKEKESFYRPHYNYNLEQRNLAYQCKSAIAYGENVDSIKYEVPTPEPTPEPTPIEETKPPKEETSNESKPLPPNTGGGGVGAFTPPSFCDVNPDSPNCQEGSDEASNGEILNNNQETSKSTKTNNNLILFGGMALMGYLILAKK